MPTRTRATKPTRINRSRRRPATSQERPTGRTRTEDAPADQRTDPEDMQAALDAAEDAEMATRTPSGEEGERPKERPPPPHSEADPGYRVFSTRFDEEIAAEDLADPAELERLRAYLDQQLEPLKGAVARLANRLQRRLQAQQNRAWDFDLEEGTLDAGRLARVVANPMTPLSFKMERDTEFRDTVVTLLLDNSGSMRGRPISIAAIRRTCWRARSSAARSRSRSSASPPAPGRAARAARPGSPPSRPRCRAGSTICATSSTSPPTRPGGGRAPNLGLMMKEGLLKENIDGEALEWAHRRLTGRPEARRVLMVISDGAPVDDSHPLGQPGELSGKPPARRDRDDRAPAGWWS